jgi:multicomponent Na+:H+ antiporter subunit D
VPDTVDLLPLGVAIPLLGATVLVLAGRFLPRAAVDALATAFAVADAACLGLAWARTGDRRVVSWLGGWILHDGHGVGIVLVGDRIGIGLALLVAALILAVLVYSWRYFDEPPPRHPATFPALLLLFEAGMCGFALTGDLFNAFVFFELMGVVAYALTGYRIEDPRPLHGALTFGVVNSSAAYASLLGIGLLYARTGELGMAQTGRQLAGHRVDALTVTALVLVLVSMLVKSATVPFHFWLPDAHAVAPTPVCMLMSGVMVELGVYGVARVYLTVFAGPGGIPPEVFTRTMAALGVLTALTGGVMCWQQRHLKRLLAFSTIGHTGLWLLGLVLLRPQATAGTALYVAGHAGVKAALFGLTGVLLDQHGSVDERGLYGRGRPSPGTGLLFAAGGLALAGLPPFGTGLGKAVSEEALMSSGFWFGPALFVLVSALTGAAVLRAGARIYFGLGPTPHEDSGPQTSGDDEHREGTLTHVRFTMVLPIVVLLGGSLAIGVLPGVGNAVGGAVVRFLDRAGYVDQALHGASADPTAALHETAWTPAGVLLGLLSAALAVGVAALALWAPRLPAMLRSGSGRLVPVLNGLRRLHSGHIGDYVAWLFVGTAALAALVGGPLL